MKRIGDFDRTPEKCVLCGDKTPYVKADNINIRKHYIEGVGQLCSKCDDMKKKDELIEKWQKQANKYFEMANIKHLSWVEKKLELSKSKRFEAIAITYEKCIKDLKEKNNV